VGKFNVRNWFSIGGSSGTSAPKSSGSTAGNTGVTNNHTHTIPNNQTYSSPGNYGALNPVHTNITTNITNTWSLSPRFELYIMADDFPTVHPSGMLITETAQEKTVRFNVDNIDFDNLTIGQKVGSIHVVENKDTKQYLYTLEDCVISELSFAPRDNGIYTIDLGQSNAELTMTLTYKNRTKVEKADKMLGILLKGK